MVVGGGLGLYGLLWLWINQSSDLNFLLTESHFFFSKNRVGWVIIRALNRHNTVQIRWVAHKLLHSPSSFSFHQDIIFSCEILSILNLFLSGLFQYGFWMSGGFHFGYWPYMCALSVEPLTPVQTFYIACKTEMYVRYLMIMLARTRKQLVICELEVLVGVCQQFL